MAKKLMKGILLFTAFIMVFLTVVPDSADARVRVKGYYRKDGTYVKPHWRSDPSGSGSYSGSTDWSNCDNTNHVTGEKDPNQCMENNSTQSSNESSITNKDPLIGTLSENATKVPKGYITLGMTYSEVLKILKNAEQFSVRSLSYKGNVIDFNENYVVSGWRLAIDNTAVKVSIGEKLDDAKPFTVGSTMQDVVDAMGTPRSYFWGDTFYYGEARVQFDSNGLVATWKETETDKLNAVVDATLEPFKLGSTKAEVVSAMGRVADSEFLNEWRYDFSSVYFDDNGKVIGWSDSSIKPILNVTMGEKDPNAAPIRVGSTLQEVIAAQGTPTFYRPPFDYIEYGDSRILFENGKVWFWIEITTKLNTQ